MLLSAGVTCQEMELDIKPVAVTGWTTPFCEHDVCSPTLALHSGIPQLSALHACLTVDIVFYSTDTLYHMQ